MSEKKEWLDFIKVFGVLFTLFLHANAPLANWQTAITTKEVVFNPMFWNISMFFAALAGMTFALIFMYLGAITLSSGEKSFSFYVGKAKRLIIPLIAWTVINILFYKYVMHRDINIFHDLFASLFRPEAINLWILYTLIAMFLILPILKTFIHHTTQQQQIYLVTLWFFAVAIPPLVEKFFDIKVSTDLPMMTGYVGYMLLGYLLSQVVLTKKVLLIALFLVFVGITWTTTYTIFESELSKILIGQYDGYFYDRFSIPMIMHSIGSFILLRYLAQFILKDDGRTMSFVKALAPKALGVCLVYPFWFVIINTDKLGIGVSAFSGNPLWSVPLTALLVITTSIITVTLMQKTPLIKRLTPQLF